MNVKEKYPHYLTSDFSETLPTFKHRKHAVKWFTHHYGDSFVHIEDYKKGQASSSIYHLIVHREDYERITHTMLEQGIDFFHQLAHADDSFQEMIVRGLHAYHTVEIFLNGRVFIGY